MKFLLRQVLTCLIEQVIILVAFKRSFQVRQIGVSEHRTPHLVSLFITFLVTGFPEAL